MTPENSPPSLIQLPTFFFSFFTVLPGTHSNHLLPYDCKSSFECGILKEISYPFLGNQQSHCGRQGFELQCQPDEYPVINTENQSFIVLEIEQNSQWMKLARSDISNGDCPLLDTQLNHPTFSFNATGIRNLSIFHDCWLLGIIAKQAYNFSCSTKNCSIGYDYVPSESVTVLAKECKQTTVPVLITAYDQLGNRSLTLKEALNEGFIAVYHFEEEEFCRKCRTSRGTCVRTTNATQVLCSCEGGLQKTPCLKTKNGYGFASGLLLAWGKLHEIAIGIARGLEYLHRGCNTRILHLDVKPHSVLLDENFCPKISDFGLAKFCPKESVISVTNARGTIGYIAPELFSRNFGRVSHKADVYSFGMMVLEMVGGRKNIDEFAEDSSEVYYSHSIYDRLQEDNSLGLHGVVSSQDNEIAKKMIITGLWCIQTYPIQRPSMNEVLFMLEGSLDTLKIPPKPFIYTPSRAPLNVYTSPIA